MKNIIRLLLIILALIIANITDYKLNVNTMHVVIVSICPISLYKALISEKFSDIFNIHSFKYTLNINSILELVASFIMGLLIWQNSASLSNSNISDMIFFVISSLLIYRFLFFNLSKKV
jgi:hypothetical protein